MGTPVPLPQSTKHTTLLYLHPSLQCIQQASNSPESKDYHIMQSTAPIASGSVLLVEHVIHGTESHLQKVLAVDTAFSDMLDPREGTEGCNEPINKIKHNAFIGPDGSMRLGPIVTRFNHRCDPDCSVRYVYEETECKFRRHTRKDGFAVIYAMRDIKSDQEVCYQYNSYAHDLFGCDCGRTGEERDAILERNRDVVGPPMVEANRMFLEGLIGQFLDKREATCAYCGKEVQNLCKGCESVSYCGAACQRSDWAAHKVICKAT
ncbi:hypothetical protein BCR33DRAFT_791388 [Rhizoclosmatium globosum]|uniref:SET domain-containing protein n=1 Tax=Rhizoclosmatium globosum TaxID=329046 RepID=A0A1Y2BFJ6_9FUNG|nr:hypothetical protein BCR33DRAFT_791388 [Rhizoclosmatium globosum]|eukprot:ORY33588.1 hypothetical protein BCR33DRAFT_791388 [Rhizoclosmatium globosum]